MQDLDVKLRDEIDSIFRESYSKLNSGDKEESVRLAELAWQKLPEPKFGWDVSKSYTHALALTYRDAGRYKDALALMDELFASGTVKPHQDQPYFVTGTIYYEMGDLDNALKWFKDAHRISKGRCFQGEEKKYLDFYKKRISGG